MGRCRFRLTGLRASIKIKTVEGDCFGSRLNWGDGQKSSLIMESNLSCAGSPLQTPSPKGTRFHGTNYRNSIFA